MKLITLNMWGGRVGKPLVDFLTTKSSEIDVFCFQEVFRNAVGKDISEAFTDSGNDPELYEHTASILRNHEGYFCPVVKNFYGLAIFVKKDFRVLDTGELVIYDESKPFETWAAGIDHSRKMQWLKIVDKAGKEYLIMNVHAHWAGQSKDDTADRLEQSRRILTFSDSVNCHKILCGDFNLKPDTQSIRMIDSKFRNLVSENGVTSTRTELHVRTEKYADYVFIARDISVCEFKVLSDIVSDHAPLFIDFEVV
jgi:endonuclease/exonuclease/phosphatase family metal-dependent hydrolase